MLFILKCMQLSPATILTWLENVKDPEIPVLSLVDLGVIKAVQLEGDNVLITMTPTFVGCPALDMMKAEIIETLKSKGIKKIVINVSFSKPWTSDDITEKGKIALKEFGLAPPPHSSMLIEDLDVLEHAECPRCGGTDTDLKSAFGATLCRSIHYCNKCRESFEQFKPL
jgi:ring-1,2-phenylacetyl-CoA epoxidase subunit PaaD